MFCISCGAKVEEAFNFCSGCGAKVERKRERSVEKRVEASKASDSNAKRQTTMSTYAQFAKAKSEERKSNFRPKKRSKPIVHEVSLNIGLMECIVSELKPCRGSSLPLKISDSASYDEILAAAMKKREAFDKRFRPKRGYVLAYPDTSIARKIPGTQEEFVLKKYKEWFGKSYSRITLYLSPVINADEFDENAAYSDDDSQAQDNDNGEPSWLQEVEEIGTSIETSAHEVEESEANGRDIWVVNPYLSTDFIPVGISETEAVDEAITISLLEFRDTDESKVILSQKTATDQSSMQNKVMAHVEKVLIGDTRNIVVSRLRIWETAKAYFKRRSFMSKTGILKVAFATGREEEDAIDHGGPRREFLHLLLGAICNDSSTLASTSLGCVIRCNFRALEDGDFKTIGQMLATIIIQGGEHPRIFSPAICSYIAKGLEFCQTGVEEVPDPVVRNSLKEVN